MVSDIMNAFKARCPLYGTLAVATPSLSVNVTARKNFRERALRPEGAKGCGGSSLGDTFVSS